MAALVSELLEEGLLVTAAVFAQAQLLGRLRIRLSGCGVIEPPTRHPRRQGRTQKFEQVRRGVQIPMRILAHER